MTVDRKAPWVSTPLVESSHLSKLAGCRIFLKLENLQPSGSFKSRGIGNYLLRRIDECEATGKRPHFYASSGGNAGIACVVAARSLGYEASVVVPTTTSPALVARLKEEGARNVYQHGQSVMDADYYLRETVLPRDKDGVYVPPFDHPDVWDGNATVMDEIAAQLSYEQPDLVVCSVGGGGLMNGVMQSLDDHNWDTSVLAVETAGADSLNCALKAGRTVKLDKITSRARSLGVATVSEKTLEYAKRPQVSNAVLTDAQAARGCLLMARHERLMVELTAGVAVALCEGGQLARYSGLRLNEDSKVVLLICGGNDISIEMLMEWQKY
ncbi:hypothetical protein VUR80DRAFT_1167 [Thermomyces stellatus]